MSILIHISNSVIIYDFEVKITAIRSQGPGGQHVNKTSTAIQLQFDTIQSSLSDSNKQLITDHTDYRINNAGVITIKAQRYRSQQQNRMDAIDRLEDLIRKALTRKRNRIATKPSRNSIKKRLAQKKSKSLVKRSRGKPTIDE